MTPRRPMSTARVAHRFSDGGVESTFIVPGRVAHLFGGGGGTADESVPHVQKTWGTQHRRRGSIYAAVLGCSLAVMVIGLSSLLMLRVERRFSEGTGDFTQARLYAYSAIQDGLFRIYNDPDWRTNNTEGVWQLTSPLGAGTYALSADDPSDNDLADSDTDPVVLTGIGTQGDARYKLQVRLVAQVTPLEVLNTCLHAAAEISINGANTVTVTGAPLSTNGNLANLGTVYGNVHAATRSGTGTITGVATIPAPPKDMPDPAVFDTYRSLATAGPVNPTLMEKQVIGSGYTSWGVTNPDGVYYIDTLGNDLAIKNTRVYGTLIIDTRGGKVILEDPVFIQPARADYPALIVNGNVTFKYKSDATVFSESACATNFNPPGVPYEGAADADQLDTYPNEVRGLIHVFGTIDFLTSARVRGVVIGGSTVVCNTTAEIVHDPGLYANPPVGYTASVTMVISPGTWRQVVD